MKFKVENIRLVNNPDSARKAYASVIVGDSIRLNDIVVVEGKNGMFISMPQRKYTDGEVERYANVYCPVTKEARYKLVNTVLEAYFEELEK